MIKQIILALVSKAHSNLNNIATGSVGRTVARSDLDISNSLLETKTPAGCFAIHAWVGGGFVVLGVGKSAFARFIIQAACGEMQDVPSPTFTLVQSYETEGGLPIMHMVISSGRSGKCLRWGLRTALSRRQTLLNGQLKCRAIGLRQL